ncbi:hypothetical protein NB636_01235 [Oxalobacter aliiformigenes]|uniref:ADP-ribosyltransferase-containing protein n=1 Tax=Oxalobacter aliiformigenes TaxID=2946593 RepID=UPI0022AF797A|nr:hypothetical protein [Oxalobacter aliiformigenes]MCZ4064139.1 hypothetical protein [Oxalobacter aliiformigenes]WAV99515.1 hypothetical protein NB636_01235 [Oxalobacter aliiformigenes]
MKEIDELTLPENNRSSVKPVSVEAAVDTVIQRRNRRQARVLFNLDDARNTNPDQENIIRKNATAVGMPVDAARAFPDDAARRANALRLQKMRLAQDFPHTMAFFEDINNARIAHDDIDNLKETESVFTNISDLGQSFAAGVVSDFFGNIAQGVEENILRSQYGAMSELQAMTGGDELSQSGIADEQGRKALMGTSRLIKEDIGEYIDIPKERRNRLRNQVAKGLGQVAGQMVVMAVTGGYGGMFFLGMQGSGQMSESLAEDRKRLLGKGINPSIAGEQAAFLGGSAVTALTEKFGLDFMTGKYTPALIRLAEKYGAPAIMKMVENRGVRFATGALLAGMGEGTQEVTEDLGQIWLRTALVDRSIQVPDAEQLWDEFLVGGLVGLITHGAVNARSIIKSGENREIVNAATDVAARAKLNERDSEAYGKYFKGVAEDSKADGAFIRKDAWDAYYQSENMDPALAAERYGITNYSEAAESGSYLEMPLERHGSDFAKTDAAIKLKDHTKYFSDPEVVTPYELALLEADQARIEKELQKTLADINVTQDRRRNLEDAIDAITEDVSAQLQARWGESTSNTQATLMARWFSVSRMRDELSKDPEATDEKIIRRIAGEWQKKGLNIRANVLPDILTKRKNVDVSVDPMLEKLRRNEWPKERDVYGQSLMEYIRKKGGLRPDDITRDLVKNRQLPRSILNEKGMGADELASLQDVLDFGLDTETMQGDNALLDALVAEYTTGEKRYSNTQLNSELLSEAQALNDLSRDLAAAGIDLSTNTDNAAVREALSKYYEAQNGENTREEPETSETERYEQRGFTESDTPTAEERAEADRQYDEIEKKYKGTLLWMKAPNGEPTKLTERQWVQVRTPNFKRWFGDWEKAGIRERLENQEPVTVEKYYSIENDRERRSIAASLIKKQFTVKKSIGTVSVSKTSMRNSFSHGTSDEKLDVVRNIHELLEKAEYLDSAKDFDGKEINNYYLATKIQHDGESKLVFFRVRERSAGSRQLYVHDVYLEDDIKQKAKTRQTSGDVNNAMNARGSDLYESILQDIYATDNESVSKVVDSNGEPLVVYHGTTAMVGGDFAFDYKKIGTTGSAQGYGFYFTTDKSTAEGYAGQKDGSLIQAYLNMRKPMPLRQKPFSKAVMKQIIKRVVEREMAEYPDEIGSWRDGFLSNYTDTYSGSFDQALNETVNMINEGSDSALEQLSEIANTSGSKKNALEAARDATGFDGVQTKGYEDNETFYISWFPENAKSVNNIGTFTDNPNILYQSFERGKEGRVRGATIIHPDRTMRIELFKDADFSTFAHETAHFMLEDFADMARSANASQYAKDEFAKICRYLNADPAEKFTREQHEKFAQSFEKYLMEGKAPSLELKDIFRKFKIWLQDIYRVLKLHVTLNKDIRDVFDRMLATDREIEVARSVNRYADTMFATAEDMGVSKEVFETYKKLNSDSIKDAQEKMLARIMRFVRQKKTKEYKEELEAVKGQVKSAYREEPASVAIRTLGDPDSEVRLDKNDLVGRYGKAYLGKLPRNGKNRLYTDEGGVDADTAAELLGYPSGDAMLEAITTLPSETEYVDAEAERIMRERYGDLLNSDYLPDLAQEVLHNEARQDMLAHELRALRKLQKAGEAAVKGKERIEKESFGMIKKRISMAKEAMKLFSERTIDNKAVSQIRPYTYLQAARKAARESFEFLAKKQYEKAAEAKYRELISTMLYSEAVKARSGIDSDRKLFSRILSGSEKKLAKTRSMNPVYRARYILARHGIGNREDYWLEKLQTAGKYENVDATAEPSKDWREMSFSEFAAMADEVKGLWELSRRDKVVEIDGKRLEVAAVAESIRDEIEKFGVADEEHVEKTGISKLLDDWSTSMKRVEQQFDMIGGEDGVLMTKVFQPMKDAAVRARLKQTEVMDRMQVAISKLKFKPGKISAPELIDKETGRPHVFGRGEICGAAEVFGALLHTGNESNYRKLLLGRGWATVDAEGRMNTSNWDAFVERMVREGVITKTHYDAAQAIWDEFEALKPLTQKANKAIYGTYFKEIGIDGIVTPFGKYKGGYVPAKTDKNVVPDAQLNELKDIDAGKVQSMMPLSQPGFTKSRSETYAEALDMNPRTIIGATNRIISFAYIAPVYNDVRKILQHDSVKNAMHRYDPGLLRDVVSPWMNRARQQTATTDLNDPGARRWATLRSRAGAMFMFNNVKNVVQSSADFLVAASEVKPGNLMAAVLNHDRKAIAEKSEYMWSRFGKSQIAMMDNIDSILIDAGTLKKADRWLMQHAYWMQQLVDDRMSAITWTAAYNDAIQDGKSELQAIRHADRIVRKVFASQNAEDVSNIEAGTAFKRLFTQFSGFFIVRSNLVATELGKIAREAGAKGSDSAATKALKILSNKKMKAAILLLTKIAIPAIVDTELALLLKGLMPGDDDWMRDMFIGSAGYVSGLGGPYANLLGESVINVANVATGGKVSSYDSRLASAPAISILEDVLKQSALIAKGGITPERIMKIGTDLTVMPIAPVVPMQVTRQTAYLAGVAGGKIKPTGPVDFVRGIVTGRASPNSK